MIFGVTASDQQNRSQDSHAQEGKFKIEGVPGEEREEGGGSAARSSFRVFPRGSTAAGGGAEVGLGGRRLDNEKTDLRAFEHQPRFGDALAGAARMHTEDVLLGGLSGADAEARSWRPAESVAPREAPGNEDETDEWVLSMPVALEFKAPIRVRECVSRAAFALNSSAARHDAIGRSLTAVVRRAGTHGKAISAQSWICDWCNKFGHARFCCPLMWSSGARHLFVENLMCTERVDCTRLRGLSLGAVQQQLTVWARMWNEGNPFACRPDLAMWQLPKRLGAWKAIGCGSLELSWIAQGFELRFLTDSVPALGFANSAHLLEDKEQAEFVDAEVRKRLAKGQFEEVEASFAAVLCPLDVVPKASGGWRLILDARWTNAHLPSVPFKMEDLRKVAEVVDPGDQLFSTDLEDAYLAFRIKPESRRFLCFEWRGKTYTNNVLPFGLGLSPWVFTKALLAVITLLRILGISVVGYVDDFLFAGKKDEIRALITFVRWLWDFLGFSVSAKSHWDPGTELTFLGLLVNTETFCFRVPAPKLHRARKMVHRLIARHDASLQVTPRELGVVAGVLMAFQLAMKPARLYTRDIYRCIASADWDEKITLSHDALSELRFWRRCLPMFNGRTIIRHAATVHLFTDVGDVAWGAHVLRQKAFGWLPWGLQGPDTSSTHRELLALLYALLSPNIAARLQNTRAVFNMDNQSAVFCINNGGSRTGLMALVAKQIWTACIRINCQAEAVWVPRELNALADGLSKAVSLDGWRLAPAVFAELDRLWGPHTIDRCADSATPSCADSTPNILTQRQKQQIAFRRTGASKIISATQILTACQQLLITRLSARRKSP